MAHDVFVSYSSKDKPVADAVCAKLEAGGTRCWIAPRDILPGRDWGEAIVEGIEQSRIMVLVFSKAANASPQVKREVERAVNKGVILVPFRIEEVTPSKNLEYFLGTPHWLDALTRPLERHLDYLADTVSRLMSGEAPQPRPAPKATPARFTPLQIGAAIGVVAIGAIALALWLGKDGGEAASGLVGEWELQAVPGGPSEWFIEFDKDGSYEGEVVFADEGTITDNHEDANPALPIGATEGGTRQLTLTPDGGGAIRTMVYTPDETDEGLVKFVSGLIPNEMIGFSSRGKAPTSIGLAFSSDWKRVSDTQWKLEGTLGDLDWTMTLTAKDDRYSFKATHAEEGTFEAEDNSVRTISEDGLIIDATYSITRDGDLTLNSSGGNGLWKPAK